jgi:hypothetical protein
VQSIVFTFTSPTYQRFSTLLVAAILTTGRRTVANLLRTLRQLAPGHPADYRRVLSRAPWSGLALGCALARFLLDHVLPDGPVFLVGDDTVDGHPGRTVYGKARHRDPVRSTHSYTAWRYGHKWVVLAVLVKFLFAARPWALPVLIGLYRSPEADRKRRRLAPISPPDALKTLLGRSDGDPIPTPAGRVLGCARRDPACAFPAHVVTGTAGARTIAESEII